MPVPFVTPDVVERMSRPTSDAVGLPRELYIDARYHELERDTVLAATWYCIGIAGDVASPGDMVPYDFSGIPLLLVRDAGGTIRAFHNVCSHRGVQLVSEPAHALRAITCPYHAWTYGLDGCLKRRPRFCGPVHDPDDKFDPVALGLRAVRCERWHELVFVNLDGRAPPLAEYVAPLAQRWVERDLALLRHGGSLRFELRANWKLVVENYCERYHLPSVHPALNRYSPVDRSFEIVGEGLFCGVGSTGYAPPPVGGATLPGFPGVSPERKPVAEYVALFPNVMIGCLYDHVYAFILQPLAVDRTAERFEFFFVGDEALDARYAAAREDCIARRRVINGEDIGIVERLQVGRRSPAMTGGVFSAAFETTNHAFQKTLLARLTG